MRTLVVNLFAGPGTGKSTNTAAIFAYLKKAGVEAEIVHEFAKDLVWEKRDGALSFQPYILGKQAWHIQRLLGQVRVIVTDSPILLGPFIYGKDDCYDGDLFRALSMDMYKRWETLNLVLLRDLNLHPFVQAGRLQTLEQAQAIDHKIEKMLTENELDWFAVGMDEPEQIADKIRGIIAIQDNPQPLAIPFKIESDCHGFGKPAIDWQQ